MKWHCIGGTHADDDPSMTMYRGEEDGFERARCHSCNVNFGDVFEVQDLLERRENGTSYREWIAGSNGSPAGAGAGGSGTVTDSTAIGRALNDRLAKLGLGSAGAAAETNGNGNGHHAAEAPKSKPPKMMTREEMEAGFRERPGFERFHQYRDAAGELVLLVARCVVEEGGKRKKAFPTATRIPAEQEGGGKWVLGDLPGGGKRPLYRLPELIATTGPLWIVEGEKAADAGAALGLKITTSSCGAGKAAKTDWGPCRGLTCYVVPDNDEAGYKHAQEVVQELKAVDARPRIVRLPGLPPKGDLFDWIEDRDSIETEAILDQLASLTRRVPEMTLEEIFRQPNPDWAIDDVIPAGGLGMVYGASASGKTFVVLDMAFTASLGWDWHGRATPAPGRWIYICGEGGLNHFKLRAQAWCQRYQAMPNVRVIPQPWMFDQEQAEVLVDDYRFDPPKALIVDTLARCMPGDENATADMNRFIAAVDYVKRELGCVVLLVHHTGHRDQHRARGSSSLIGAVDFAIHVERIGEEPVMLLKSAKSKSVESFEQIGVELQVVSVLDDAGNEQLNHSGKVITSCLTVPASKQRLREAMGLAVADKEKREHKPRTGRPSKASELRDIILGALANGPMMAGKLIEACGCNPKTARKVMEAMEDEGRISSIHVHNSKVYRLDSGSQEHG